MSRKPRRSLQKSPVDISASICESRALVWIDKEPLLEAGWDKCKALEQELDRAQDELERYRTIWQPAYLQWFHENFGERVMSLRGLGQKAAELQLIIASVESYSVTTGCSKRDGYAHITRTRTGSAFLEEIRFRQANSQPKQEAPEEAAEECGEWEKEEPEQPFHEQAPPSNDCERLAQPEETEDLRRKELYRELARQLHPDLNPNQSKKEQDLWHEIKNAHRARDLGALEALAAIVEGRSISGKLKVESLSQLHRLQQELEARLETARQKAEKARTDRAWRFSEVLVSPRQILALEQQLCLEMEKEAEISLSRIRASERQIARWKMVPPAKPRLPRKLEAPPQLDLFGSSASQ